MRHLRLTQKRAPTTVLPASFGKHTRRLLSRRSGVPLLPLALPLVFSVIALTVWWLSRRIRGRNGRTVKDVMIDKVISVDTSATLTEAAQLMRDANIGVLPVVEGGRLRGLLTDRDIVIRAVVRGTDSRSTRVAEYATADMVCARPEWSVDQASRAMARHQIGRLPVVDEGGRLVGIVTLSSLALRSHDAEEALQAAEEVSRRSARQA